MILPMAFLPGCSRGSRAENRTERTQTVFLNFPTANMGGAVFTIGAALANIWNENIDGLLVSAEASNGGIQNLGLMASGDAHVSVAVTSIITEQKQGIGVFSGRQYEGVRILSALYSNYNQIVVDASTGIRTLNDVAGRRFAPGAPGSTTEVETRLHMTAAGMSYPDDIRAQFVGFSEAVDLMRNRQLDGVWVQAGIPTAAVSEMYLTAGGTLISMDAELVRKMTTDYSWYNHAYIPAGTYEGQNEDIRTTSITITLIIDEKLSDDLVYEMTRVLWENIERLKTSHSALRDVTLEHSVQNLAGLPLHPGSERYYREMGLVIMNGIR
ncbi:MAG: TAXI family TRAP transporter solute-binding subunit [Treponema sp.]|nr:TAXI family TRAP transporter solute-binding subunit [Treponema sp.]